MVELSIDLPSERSMHRSSSFRRESLDQALRLVGSTAIVRRDTIPRRFRERRIVRMRLGETHRNDTAQ